MKILNLTDPKRSDIKYNIVSFPDGQKDITMLSFKYYKNDLFESFSTGNNTKFESKDIKIQIKSRFNSFEDLELIICATKILRRFGVKEIHLYIPYLLGARSDRQFIEGGTSYLVDVIAPIINSLEFETVTVMDVHSDVAAACIKNLKVINNINLVEWSLYNIYKMPLERIRNYMDNFVLISPDAGSLKKIYKVVDAIGYKGEIITCNKYRDENGKLSKINVPITGEQHNMLYNNGPYKDFVIIDDICDGGATFINIAKDIKAYFHESGKTKSKIYLIVTHGIFSKGIEELSKYFNGIYCTNSYSTIWDGTDAGKLIRQLNVF